MNKPVLYLSLTFALALVSACALSQTVPDRMLDTADSNGDGKITREEFRTARRSAFARLDRNGDGFLDAKDRPRLRSRRGGAEQLGEGFRELDADGDGRVSLSEFESGPMPAFDRADSDKDGELSAEEIAAAKSAAEGRAASKRR